MSHRGFWFDINSLSQTYVLYYTNPCVSRKYFYFSRRFLSYPQDLTILSVLSTFSLCTDFRSYTNFTSVPVKRIFHSPYSIPIIVSPCAGAVGPAAVRSFFPRICGISSGASSPPPTRISVPAIIRTILYKNPFPVTRMVIMSFPSFSTSRGIDRARRCFDLCPNCTKALEIMLSHKIRCRLASFCPHPVCDDKNKCPVCGSAYGKYGLKCGTRMFSG